MVSAGVGARRYEQQLLGALYANQLEPITDVYPHRLGYYAA